MRLIEIVRILIEKMILIEFEIEAMNNGAVKRLIFRKIIMKFSASLSSIVKYIKIN